MNLQRAATIHLYVARSVGDKALGGLYLARSVGDEALGGAHVTVMTHMTSIKARHFTVHGIVGEHRLPWLAVWTVSCIPRVTGGVGINVSTPKEKR